MATNPDGFMAAKDAVLIPVNNAAKQCAEGVFLLHAQYAFIYNGEIRPIYQTTCDKAFADLMAMVRRFEPMTWEIRYHGTDFKKMPDGFCVAYSTREPRYTVPEMREWEKHHAKQ
jgi:hypothetical protein